MLQWMAKAKDTNARVTRWFFALQDFDFVVKHRLKHHYISHLVTHTNQLRSNHQAQLMALNQSIIIQSPREGFKPHWKQKGGFFSRLKANTCAFVSLPESD